VTAADVTAADALGTATVATTGSTDPPTPLIVPLHGRGSQERETPVPIARHCPLTFAHWRFGSQWV
jgi:hypothetical protein